MNIPNKVLYDTDMGVADAAGFACQTVASGKYRAIKAVSWRVNISTDAIADFEGLLGSSARKTVQWTVFSENGLASPGGKSRNPQVADVGCADALCGIALGYYTQNSVSIGDCAKLAGMREAVFMRFLSRHGVGIFDPMTEEDLLRDIANA